ncbi:abortive infection protein [Fibrella aestuarina BUZ 2]|uniref:Abortive infection protein n=1 Tax=Fibrella aestuarina BUZ 2 TaxID=1166018 RepID=I0K6Q0_9BACT|nr:CPBP family intramembrane glutamic endopeptidase [Fibrella aestuarina]CCG99803.1 abortive infection protein [Fibrella aestuarina BUZ 2]
MTDLNASYRLTPEPQPLRSLLLLIGFILLGGAVGGVLAVAILGIASVTSGGEVTMMDVLQAPNTVPNGWWWLMAVQSVSHVCTFLLPALLYWKVIDRRTLGELSFRPADQISSLSWLLVVLLVIAFMPFNGLLIEWNQHISLPDALKPLEQWMREKEDQAAELTKFLTDFRTVPQLLLAVVVIGLLPAIGEEVLFRGLLQRKFIVWTGNIHVGVWLAAAVFSAIHVQFYGFVPRMLLGALFGYLFVWSGNLWVPILAHFVNNGFTVIMYFLYQNKYTNLNVDDTESVPAAAAVASLLVTVVLLVLFRKQNGSRQPIEL